MRILVVDDDRKVASMVASGLEQEGHKVTIAHDGQEGLDQLMVRDFDVAVLDIMMPKMDGLSLIKVLRQQGMHTPVLILSAKRNVSDRVEGLRAGGDDYLVKPFAFAELYARIESLLRRSRGVAEPRIYRVGDLVVDSKGREVRREGKQIDLQPKEYALLEYLIRNSGRIVSKTMIMEHVWGYDFESETNVVEARVSRLREKVDKPFERAYICTVRGAGYVIRDEKP